MQRHTVARDTIAAALERDSAWLHRLAQALTRDSEAALDVAQTTLLRAWERSVHGALPPRAWLARVARNLLRDDARRTGRRRAPEETAGDEVGSTDVGAEIERLELQRLVVDAVDALPEPYRTTLVLRFFDGLSPAAIAGRQGLPRDTVYTHIERGLARLRHQLDTRFGGDRTAWTAALLAVPANEWTWTSACREACASSLWVKLTGSALIAVGTITAFWLLWPGPRSRAGQGEPDEAMAVASIVAGAPATERDPIFPGGSPTRALTRTLPESRDKVEATAASVRLSGQVLDVEGRPLSGVDVCAEQCGKAGSAHATSALDGRFTIAWSTADLPATFAVDDAQYASLRNAVIHTTTVSREHRIVAARAADLSGFVSDEYGYPLAGASVSLVCDDRLLVDFPLPLDTTTRARPRTVTGEDGGFRLPRSPIAAGCLLRAEKQGFEPAHHEPAEPYAAEVVIQLRALPPERLPLVAEGVVLLPDGGPAAGATVRYGPEEVKADEHGRFGVPLADTATPDLQLAAGLTGYGTALVERYGELQLEAAPYPPAPVTLVLRAAALSIVGRVVAADGAGLDAWKVQLRRGTPLTRHQTPPVLAEALGDAYPRVETSEDGSFELTGLLDRDYMLFAYHPNTLLALEAGPYAAGTRGVILEVPAGATFPRLAGRVVSRSGAPVAGALVSPGLVLHRMEDGNSWISGGVVMTDPDGRFAMTDVPRAHVHLDVDGQLLVPQRHELDGLRDPLDLEIRVALRCHLRVEVTGAELPDLIVRAEDGDGRALPIYRFSNSGSASNTLARLAGGKLPVVAVSEDALELVLLRADSTDTVELARQPLHLVPGEVSDVRFELGPRARDH